MKIPFICVNYQAKEETVKYIENVLSLSSAKLAHIIVVDNSKHTEDFIFLEQYISSHGYTASVSLVRVEENKGYFHGLNIGIAHAQKIGIKNCHYIIGNNDIQFEHHFIEKLLTIVPSEQTLVLAPDVITKDSSHENPHVVNRMGFLRKLKFDVYFSTYSVAKLLGRFRSTDRRHKEFDPEKKFIYMGIGALYILTPQFFNFFDSLWDKVFLYGEEAIFAGQVKSVGGKIQYDPSLVCYHNESVTTSQMDSEFKYNTIRTSYKIYRQYL